VHAKNSQIHNSLTHITAGRAVLRACQLRPCDDDDDAGAATSRRPSGPLLPPPPPLLLLRAAAATTKSSCAMAARAPSLFISHGGGPMPLMGDPGHASLIEFLTTWPSTLARPPAAIVLVSAHWEEISAKVSTGAQPQLLFDYGGFPPHTYQYKYPAPGDPELGVRMGKLLEEAGIPVTLDPSRAWDHGVFVPLMLMYPAADIPIVQLSLLKSYDP
jgi:hypothetical protein